jgi:hypothetical protein
MNNDFLSYFLEDESENNKDKDSKENENDSTSYLDTLKDMINNMSQEEKTAYQQALKEELHSTLDFTNYDFTNVYRYKYKQYLSYGIYVDGQDFSTTTQNQRSLFTLFFYISMYYLDDELKRIIEPMSIKEYIDNCFDFVDEVDSKPLKADYSDILTNTKVPIRKLRIKCFCTVPSESEVMKDLKNMEGDYLAKNFKKILQDMLVTSFLTSPYVQLIRKYTDDFTDDIVEYIANKIHNVKVYYKIRNEHWTNTLAKERMEYLSKLF